MLKLIRKELSRIIQDIDAGNTNLTEEEALLLLHSLKEFNTREKYFSKYQAYTFLGISRAEFDNRVREGLIPRGIKVAGFKELRWKEKDIKDLIKKPEK